MTLGKIISNVIRFIPKTEGAAGRVTLGRTQLEALGKQEKEAGELIQKVLSGLKDPKLDIAYKAKSNYAIAGIRLRDGKQVVGQSAVSLTNPGSSNSVIKFHNSNPHGMSRGFIDGGKAADTSNMAVSSSRRNGMVQGNIEIGEAAALHYRGNEQGQIEMLRNLGFDDVADVYTTFNNQFQKGADDVMAYIRNILRGGSSSEAANKVIKLAEVPSFDKKMGEFYFSGDMPTKKQKIIRFD